MKAIIILSMFVSFFFISYELNANCNNELIQAVSECDLKKTKTLVNQGANINFKDSQGFTPLFYAFLKLCSVEFIDDLLDLGADPLARNNNNIGILAIAITAPSEYKPIVKKLKREGAFLAEEDIATMKQMGFNPDGSLIDSGLPKWADSSGWVEYSEICGTADELLGIQYNCESGTQVTELGTLGGNIYWAGSIKELYFDFEKMNFTFLRIEVEWISSSGNNHCGETLELPVEKVKEFTKTSFNLRKCQ